jgi:dihydrofolate reductase
MNIIAAVDKKGGLGKDGQLLVRLGADMKRFKELTSGGVVIMGRKTLDSLPGGKPLPNRRNIVLTRNEEFSREGVEVAHSVLEVLQLIKDEEKDKVWVIGGGEIYAALIPFCENCYLTRIDKGFEADTFFPSLGPDWIIEDLGYLLQEQDIVFSYERYKRR